MSHILNKYNKSDCISEKYMEIVLFRWVLKMIQEKWQCGNKDVACRAVVAVKTQDRSHSFGMPKEKFFPHRPRTLKDLQERF